MEPSQGTENSDSRADRQSGYEAVLTEFGPSLGRLASSYEALPQAREDLLQDIRLALWIALPKFRGESSLRTFVYRVAHNRGLTHVWRRKQRGVPATLDEVDISDHRPGPEAAAMIRDRQARLLRAIQSLPILLKQVMTLALEDVSNTEIASVLGLTENNVAVRLNRARALLREKMGNPR